MLYSHNNYLVSVKHVEEDGEILTPAGYVQTFIGDYILTDQYGNKTVTNEKWFNDNYSPVEKVQTKPSKRKRTQVEIDYIAEAYAQGWVGLESEQYIEVTSELTKNKAF